jgi:OPT family oligopeptide transporter
LWGGAACMVTSGLLTFAFEWRTILRALSGLGRIFRRRKQEGETEDPLVRVEVPGSWFAGGMTVGTVGVVAIVAVYFGVAVWMALLAVLLSFFLALVACRATGETDTTPVGAMGKITQLTYGALAPKQMNTNLMTACITAGVADSAADLLTDLKSGYCLGANARQQFLAQFSGIFVGTAVVVPAFYLIVPDVSAIGSNKFPAPAAQVWASVARLLSNGFESLHPTARLALLIGGLVGLLIPMAERLFPKARAFIPSAMGLGLAFCIPFWNCLSMFIGGLVAFFFEKARPTLAEKYTIPTASGLIAGESLAGIFITLGQTLGWM